MIEWFALADVQGLTKSQANAINLWLRQHRVSMVKKPRHIKVEKSRWQGEHKRVRRCNYYRNDEAIKALIKETNQKLVLEARQIVLAHLGVYA